MESSSSSDVWGGARVSPLFPVFAPPAVISEVRAMTTAKKRRLAVYAEDGYSEWQVLRAESVRQAAGLREDEDFPLHVYPAPRVRAWWIGLR